MLPKHGIGAEVGVWKGDFSQALLTLAKPRLLHLIDPWQASDEPDHAQAWYGKSRVEDLDQIYHDVVGRFSGELDQDRVRIHRRRSVEVLAHMPPDSLDFVYVDGDHRYQAVRADLELAVAKVRPGGVIVADDHMLGGWWGDGVVRAVNEVLGTHPSRLMLKFCAGDQAVIEVR